jgi:hypothetical protein
MGEWTGPWADGSREWTPYWMEKLGHKFGDDGLFWMSYEDLLKRFDLLDRTRLFDQNWTVVQHWTSVSVAWVTGYLNTKFSVEIKKSGPTIFVLSQVSYAPIISMSVFNNLSSMTDTSVVLKANTTLTCTLYSKNRAAKLATTLSALAVHGSGIVASQPKSTSKPVYTK